MTQNQTPKLLQMNVHQIDTTAGKKDDEESVNYITSYQQLFDQVYDSNYNSDSDDYVAAIFNDSANHLEPLNAQIKLGSVQANAMIDSGRFVSLITKTLANRILTTSTSAKWTTTKQDKDMKTFSNEPIKVLGNLTTTLTYNDWNCKEASLTVVEDGHKLIIGRDLFNSLGLAVIRQQAKNGKCVNNIDNSTCKIKETIASQFPYLLSRIGLSKTHVAKSKFYQKFTAKHQKSRLVAINLKPRVTIELDELQKEGHIKKLSSFSNEHFISPIVITVKKDQFINLTLDSKVLNKPIQKNKYQMPKIEMLIGSISQQLTNTQDDKQSYFLTIDLQYADIQLLLHKETAKNCKFSIIYGESFGTYRLKTGFYGTTDMPAEFQKVIDYTFVGPQNTYCFLDDIIIVSTGSESDHLSYVTKCLKN